ncbi:potassium channel family protein [Nafulsella turpanensis]|uniref:potassium channel family protein n=1 Tax=Nafulsella turpanensis TaxID=1265690 RepID=UPI0003723844|nr:potassium channel family protein [Nafulsella turpanensis]
MNGKEINILLLIIGVAVTLWSITEALWTTLWADKNSSPLTSRLTTLIWKAFRTVANPRDNSLLNFAGPVILIASVLFWIMLLWIGWTLIFYSVPGAALLANTNTIPDLTDIIWFVGYCIFTVGNGDLTPNGDVWQVVTSLVGFSGMGLVTLSITYLLQVVAAVVNKRSFSSQVAAIGNTAEKFVKKEWDRGSFRGFELQLNALTNQLSTLSEQHLAFPILHYYHTANVEKSHPMAVAILYDAILLIELGVEEQHKPAESILSSARQSVDSFLETLKGAFITPAKDVPPQPKLSSLSEKGIPIIPEKEFYQKLEANDNTRKLLLGLIKSAGWHWPT